MAVEPRGGRDPGNVLYMSPEEWRRFNERTRQTVFADCHNIKVQSDDAIDLVLVNGVYMTREDAARA